MPSSLIRVVGVAAVLFAATVSGDAQGLAPRALPVEPGGGMNPGYPGGGYPPGYGAPGNAYQPPTMSVVDPDKKLSAGDQVTIEIIEDRAGGFPKVVTATGELDVPPLGKVRVSGKTASEAASSIKQLLERDYYYSATVRVSIDQVATGVVRKGTVQLSGQVRMQGPQMILAGEPLTATGALLKAGGLTQWADTRKVQLFRVKPDGSVEKIIVDFKKVTETGDIGADPVLQDGDRLYVPKKPFNI